jgi:hypothetical protein
MARFEDSPDLFGSGIGHSTCGDFICDLCKTQYNTGNDKTENYSGDSVPYTEFAGLVVCGDCFEEIEDEVLHRMPDILKWYKRIMEARKKDIDQGVALLDGL